jgi:hypothetical protein
MIQERMRLRLFKKLITYGILILYVLTPMLDSMVCAGCMDDKPFQCETTSGHLLQAAPNDDVISAPHDGAQSPPPVSDEHAAKSFCSICANFLTGVEVFSPNVHTAIAPWDGPCAVPALSELHYSIDKPPQNLLG